MKIHLLSLFLSVLCMSSAFSFDFSGALKNAVKNELKIEENTDAVKKSVKQLKNNIDESKKELNKTLGGTSQEKGQAVEKTVGEMPGEAPIDTPNEITVPINGDQIYDELIATQKQNAAAEEILINELSKIHAKDFLRVTVINSKKQTGPTTPPDIEKQNDKIKLSIGAIIDFDIDKYKNEVVTPLRNALKQASTNGGVPMEAQLGTKYESKGLVKEYVWEYGNVAYKEINNNYARLTNADDYEIIINVAPSTTNIFKSTYEAYQVKYSEKLEEALLTKIAEGNLLSIHFVFKDEQGQEVFHEKYQAMRTGHYGRYNGPQNHIRQNEKGPRFEAEYALFIPYAAKKVNYLPMLISPEILGPNETKDGRDKNLVVCEIEANAADIQKIRSFETFIEEKEYVK